MAYAANFSGSTNLGDGQLTGDLAADNRCSSGSRDAIFGLADFTLEAGLGQSIGVLIGASLGLALVIGSGFLAPDLEPFTAALEVAGIGSIAARGEEEGIGSRGLGGIPSRFLSASLSAFTGNGSGTCQIWKIYTVNVTEFVQSF